MRHDDVSLPAAIGPSIGPAIGPAVASSIGPAVAAPPRMDRAAPRDAAPPARARVKRAMDVVLALAGLAFFLPVGLVIAAVLLLQDGRPLLFRQQRVGLGGRLFECWKFRSMVKDADRRLEELLSGCERSRREWEANQKLERDPRIHPVGAILRRSSLDELPQLVNILRGDMSVVGPRPVLERELERYGRFSRHYLAQRPGLTGLWQVSGRSDTTYSERVRLDVEYSRSWTLGGDVAIIARTVAVVLAARGSR